MNNLAGTQGALQSSLETIGTKAFNPDSEEASRGEAQREFGNLISSTGTTSLIAALNALIKPNRVPRWLALRFMDVLTLLPQRPDGVRATLEFIFSTHPSSTVKASEAAGPQKQGANITMEAMKMAANLLATPPAGVTPEQWFPGIAPQLLALLDGAEGPDLVKVAAYVIGFGILGRRQFGAPGTPGWRSFAEPMLAAINPSLSSDKAAHETMIFTAGPDDIVDLQKETIIRQPVHLALALKRLTSQLNSHPNPGLTTRLLSPLVKPLWTLSSWPEADLETRETICSPARNLLSIYFKIAGQAEKYLNLVDFLLYNGDTLSENWVWRYSQQEPQICVVRARGSVANAVVELDWESLGPKAVSFVEILQCAASDTDISTVFLTLFRRSFAKQLTTQQDVVMKVDEDEEKEDPVKRIIESQVLQVMMDRIPDKLVADSKGLLELASQVLADFEASSENAESVAVALSLLNIVITTPNFQRSDMNKDVLNSIESSLERISQAGHPDISQTAKNLRLLLTYRDEIEDPLERTTAPTDRQIEDRKTYSLAMSYITQLDSPPPVRAEGLNLISGLIKANSSVVDIQGILVLCSSLLGQEDDYMNVRVMKLFVQLSEKHPKSVLKELLEHYVDADERANVDTRLRFGESILQVVQRLGDMFSGDAAIQVGESMLSIAGRRGHRAKTEAKQNREQRLREQKQKAAEKAWGGDVPDLSELQEEGKGQTEEEKARDDVLAQILQGWESKRGSEDIRIRASALSVFLVGMETNIAGYGSTLVEASVDLCLNILTIETEMETAILRRAAIVLILTFVKALADAREAGKRLGFGLTDASREEITRILDYVAGTDTDGLVRQHASDVAESLRNWQMTSMLPEMRAPPAGLETLAGLNLGRPDLPATAPAVRPRIEEIE
ncbi:hypothetical protein PFICI_08512 [Pestalotiopsis fici W106-1]|uniref:RNA polymerase II assembly factor Rtp1 C-terminal domain-containing protein n=1 Tax=Pestalotiopsis fici (strain W106-1 / CGMCC3.15140) TaxID=1229662 RepID=W3WXY7_PESFW|nr:uncharacterized protein PFICI_08512 [Pestalotiopsis fici W106-1]ETS78659.1 hypothetical protein PFICI_08512 [Pestalotiopsis fici W106-1]